MRFHGHSQRWESKDIYDRFGYRYTEEELAQWAPKVAQLAEKASEVHVLMNNCYQDYAQVNARQLADLLPVVGPPGQWPLPPRNHPTSAS